MHYCRNSDRHSFLRKVYGTNLGINVGGLAHMRFLVSVITCADIYNERPTLGSAASAVRVVTRQQPSKVCKWPYKTKKSSFTLL